MSVKRERLSERRFPRALWIAVFAALVSAVACGGGNRNSGTTSAGTSTMQFRLGDAPADRVISFEVTLASPIVLTPTGGGSDVNVTLGDNRLEITHTSAASEPLVISSIPQGSYTSAKLTVNHPEVTFINSAGVVQKIESNASTQVTVSLNPALTVGASAGVVTIDLNAANSLTFDGQGNVTGFNFTGSSFVFSTKALGNGENEQDDEGEIEDLVGMVTSVSGNNFTISVGQSVQLTFATDANTEFKDGVTNVASLVNQIVKVEGFTKPDGTLYAKEVEGVGDEAELEGFITTVTGNPATAMTLVSQDGAGAGMDKSKMGEAFTINVNGLQTSKYRVKQGGLNFDGLDVPSATFPFDATTIHAGQRVEIDTDTTIPAAGGTVVADKVNLQQQTLTGTVSAMSADAAPRTITLTVPADSALATVSGVLTVTVFDQAKSDHHRMSSTVNVGDQIRVRGLVFFTSVGQANMIARRITMP